MTIGAPLAHTEPTPAPGAACSTASSRLAAMSTTAFVLLAALLLAASTAQATDYYACDCQPGADAACVPGNDANPGTTQSAPLQSYDRLQDMAYQRSSCGDTFNFCKGGSFAVTGSQRWWTNVDCRDSSQGGTQKNVTIGDYTPPWGKSTDPRPRLVASGTQSAFVWTGDQTMQGLTIENLELECVNCPRVGSQPGLFIFGPGGYLTFDNLEIHGFNEAIYVTKLNGVMVPNVTLKNSFIHDNLRQGWLGSGPNAQIIDNLFEHNGCIGGQDSECMLDHHIYFGGGRSVDNVGGVIRGNELYRSSIDTNGKCHGVSLNRLLGKGLIVEDNWIHEDPDKVDPNCYGIAGATNGLATDGCFECIFRRNRLENVALGFSLSGVPDVVIEDNVVILDESTSGRVHHCTGIEVKQNSLVSNGNSQVKNNSIYISRAEPQCTGIKVGGQGGGHVVSNNTVQYANGLTDARCYAIPDPTLMASVDHNNCFFESGSSGYWANTSTTLADWRKSSGLDANSTSVDSGFVDAASYDLSLSQTSALVNAGSTQQASTFAVSLTCDATQGKWPGSCLSPFSRDATPDVGAYELGGTSTGGGGGGGSSGGGSSAAPAAPVLLAP